MQPQYVLLGGIVAPRDSEANLGRAVMELRDQFAIYGEFKWTKVSSAKLPAYIALADLFFANRRTLSFQAIVASNRQVQVAKSKGESFDRLLESMQVELLVRIIVDGFRQGDACTLFVDERPSTVSLRAIRTEANYRTRKQTGSSETPVREVRSIVSHVSWQVQLADVLLGAVGFETNGFLGMPGSSPAKNELVHYIKSRLKLTSLVEHQHSRRSRFAIHRYSGE